MTPTKHLIAISALALALTTESWGAGTAPDHQAASTSSPPMEEMIVTATNSPLSLSKVPANVSVLTQKDVRESPAQTVDQLLRQIPGFTLLYQSDAIASSPSTQTVSLRGLGGTAASRTLVMLNGIPLNSPYTSEVYWARIPKYRIKRIEIVRGGGSPIWGNLAMGGVINILTERPRSPSLDATVAVSDPNTLDMSAAASDVVGRWSLSTNVESFDTDGYPIVPARLRGAVDENVTKKFHIVSGRAEYAFSNTAYAFVDASRFEEHHGSGTPLDQNDDGISSFSAGANFDTRSSDNWRANVFYDSLDLHDASTAVSPDRNSEVLRSLKTQPSQATGANLVWSHSHGKHKLMAGVDYRGARADIGIWSRIQLGVPTRYQRTLGKQSMAGAFFQDIWESTHLEVISSGRFDTVADQGSVLETDLATGAVLSQETYARHADSVFDPSIGVRYQVGKRVALRGSVYKGFRAPTLRELYLSSSTRGGNVLVNDPQLAPERLTGIEGGVDLRFSEDLRVKATLFQDNVSDMVQNVTRGVASAPGEVVAPCGAIPAGYTCQVLDNVGEISSKGLELAFDYQPLTAWTFSASYLFNDALVSKAPSNPQIVGKQVRQAPKNSLSLKLNYSSQSHLDATIEGRYVGKRYNDDLNTLNSGAFFLIDTVLTFPVGKTWQLFTSIENVFDKEYVVRRTSTNFTEIGRPRSLTLGFHYSR